MGLELFSEGTQRLIFGFAMNNEKFNKKSQ